MKISDKISKIAGLITASTIIIGALSTALVWINKLHDRLDSIEKKLYEKDSEGKAIGLRINKDSSYLYRHFDNKLYPAAYDYNIGRWYYIKHVQNTLQPFWCFEP